MLTKMETNEGRMDVKIDANKEKMEASTEVNNEKFEVLRGTLVSRMDIHEVRPLSYQREMKAKMDIHQEKMEAATHYNRSELEETTKHWAEDILSCVDQKKQGLCKELSEKTDETQVDL
jgi:hypothetical protein